MSSTCYYTTAGVTTSIMTAATAVQPDQVLQWISLAVTILGAIVSFIILPIIDWIKKQKDSDEKTTIDDVKELVEDIKDGVDNVKQEVDNLKERGDEDGRKEDSDDQ